MPPLTLAHGCYCARWGTQLKKQRPQLTLGLVLNLQTTPRVTRAMSPRSWGRSHVVRKVAPGSSHQKWHRPPWVTDQRAPPTLPVPLAGRRPLTENWVP